MWLSFITPDMKYAFIIRVSCFAQAVFPAFGRGAQLISGFPYAESEQCSHITSFGGRLAFVGIASGFET